MLHCNFVEITLWHGCSPVNLLDIFRRPSYKNTSWRATSSSTVCCYKWIEIKHHYSRQEYSVECKVSECEDINTWKSVLCVNENVLLIFPALCIAESSVKIRINSYFYFHTSLCCLRRLHRKQMWKWKFKFIFLSLFEIGTGRVNKFINKVVIIYKQILKSMYIGIFLEKIQTIGFYQNSDVLFYPGINYWEFIWALGSHLSMIYLNSSLGFAWTFILEYKRKQLWKSWFVASWQYPRVIWSPKWKVF